jgi:glycosyltransferase 2 family protein
MNKKIKSLIQYAIILALVVFLVWWSLASIKPEQWPLIKQSLTNANYWLLLPVVIALLASHLSRAVRWKILMEPMGYKPKLSNTYMAVLIGYMANLAVPRLGEVLKCTVLARYEKVPADKMVGTIVAERAFDLVCLVLVMVITIITQTDLIGDFLYGMMSETFGSKTKGFSVTRILIILGILAILLAGAIFIFKKFSHVGFIMKIRKVIDGIWQGLTSVRFVKKKGWFIFHSIFIWAMYLLSVQIGMYALTETAGFGIKASMAVLFSGSIAMIITPSGIGAYPILVSRTMTLYGLDEAYGQAFGWLLWTVQFFQMLLCGGIALILLPYLNKQTNNHEKSTGNRHQDPQPGSSKETGSTMETAQ